MVESAGTDRTPLVVEIVDPHLAEPEHLAQAFWTIARSPETTHSARIFCSPREQSGWIEYVVHLFWSEERAEQNRPFVIGVIQREVGGKIECHS